MTERQLDRIENQNKIFLSDSEISDDSSVEEQKIASNRNSATINSFEQSPQNNLSRTSDNPNNVTRINTTAKSIDSGLEQENLRAFQETMDSFQPVQDKDSNRARQEMLQFAQKAYAEKSNMSQ